MEDLGQETVEQILAGFKCPLDQDVEGFLHKTAIRYEKQDAARTYLILNSDGQHKGKIAAYFSMSFTEIEVCPEASLSKTQQKKICKTQAGIQTVKAILLGQLGKDPEAGANLNVEYLINEVRVIAAEAQNLIAGRVLLLECSECEKLIRCYESVGFTQLQVGPQGLNQMYIII